MDIRPLQPEDVTEVLRRLCRQHRDEYRKIGYPGPEFAKKMADYIDAADTKVAGHIDGKAQVFFAIAPGGESTWLAMTDDFVNSLDAMRSSRRFMRECAAKYGRVWAFVGSDHPQVVKWMRLLGFDFVAERAGTKLFICA